MTEAALEWDEKWGGHGSIVGAPATGAHRLKSGSLTTLRDVARIRRAGDVRARRPV